MKTDGVFDFTEIRIPFKKYGTPIHLYAVGDIHRNSPNCDIKKWKEFLAEAKADKHDSYFILLGDLVDSFSTSERRSYIGADFHESTTRRLEEVYSKDAITLANEMAFMRGRVVAVIGGNHYFTFQDGTTTDQYIARALESKYLGCNAIIRLCLRSNTRTHQIDLCVHHGLSGGRTCGSSINKLQQMANYFDADIYLQAHDHNRCIDYINRLGLSNQTNGNLRLVNKKMLLGRTGSFLKGYEPKVPSYAVDSMLPPNDLGALKIILTPMRQERGRWRPDYDDKRWVDIKAEV